MTTPATITLRTDDGSVIGHAAVDGGRWYPTCDLCNAPNLLPPVRFPMTAVQMLLAHLESAHKEAA